MVNTVAVSLLANHIRQDIISMLTTAGSGHPAGALGMADVYAVLYSNVLQHDPQQPNWPDRDRVILSNGHTCPALYATLAELGYFPPSQLQTLRKLGSRLQGHPHLGSLPGVENSSGPLGQGLSLACGLAWGLRFNQKPAHVYCFLSDGEHDEGQTWEAYLLGAKERLANLTVLVDRNRIQIDGNTEDVLPLGQLQEKLSAFNWRVATIDAHDFSAIEKALADAKNDNLHPWAIICQTIPGKGVSFMEDDYRWHGKAPTAQEAEQALQALRKAESLLHQSSEAPTKLPTEEPSL